MGDIDDEDFYRICDDVAPLVAMMVVARGINAGSGEIQDAAMGLIRDVIVDHGLSSSDAPWFIESVSRYVSDDPEAAAQWLASEMRRREDERLRKALRRFAMTVRQSAS